MTTSLDILVDTLYPLVCFPDTGLREYDGMHICTSNATVDMIHSGADAGTREMDPRLVVDMSVVYARKVRIRGQ